MPDLTTAQLQRLTSARWQGEQALFTTAVAMLTERQASEPQCAVVKPLAWEDFCGRGAKASAWLDANYMIQRWSDGRWEISASYLGYSTNIDDVDRFHHTIEAAKAAAQADYEARIRGAVTLRPEAEVRAEAWATALEAAATRIDEMVKSVWDYELSHAAPVVRAMITDDTSAALDRIKAEAEAEGMREAARVVNALRRVNPHSMGVNWWEVGERAILAAIPKATSAASQTTETDSNGGIQ